MLSSLYQRPWCSVLVAVLVSALASGCVSRGITKPRSELLKESDSEASPEVVIQQEREEFYNLEKENQARIVEFLRQRSSADFRDATYRIGPGDEVEINVFDVPELNVTAKVRQSGFVSLPLVGAVQAAGVTESDLNDELKKRLSSFVRNPQVNVFLSHYGSQKIAVMGAVNKPGTYSLKKGANSVLELISAAGGVSDKAGNFVNFIPAEFSGVGAANDVEARAKLALASEEMGATRQRGLELYLDQVMGTTGSIPLEIPVRGGDMIVVPEAGKVMVEGEVEKPGSFELGRSMTLLGALAASGGITTSAKIDQVEVVRDRTIDDKLHLVLDLEQIARGELKDVRLRNGDIVRVPSDSGRRLKNDTFESISKIINFGIGGSVPLH